MTLVYIFVAVVVLTILIGKRGGGALQKAKESGAYPADGQGTDDDVLRLAQAGNKIWAIRLYREIHGCGLKESKNAVEWMLKQAAPAKS